MALMGAEILLYPTAIGSEPHDAKHRLERPLAAHHAGPCGGERHAGGGVESHRHRKGEKYTMTFYGSSFIASHTGEKAGRGGSRQTETVLTAAFDLDADAPLPAGLGRVPRPAPRPVLPPAVARWPRLRTFRRISHSSIWKRRAAIAAYDRITEVGIRAHPNNGELIEEWSSLVNPECPHPGLYREFHRHQQRNGRRCAALRRHCRHGLGQAARRSVRCAQCAFRLLASCAASFARLA